MSIVHSQPSPFGYLQREKHIEHRTKVSKEKKMCRCMEVSHRQPSNQKDGNNRHSYRTKGNSLQYETKESEKCSDSKSVRSSIKGVTPITSVSASSSHSRPTDRELRVQRTLTVVEELDESVCSGLQILANAQQFCITSKAKLQACNALTVMYGACVPGKYRDATQTPATKHSEQHRDDRGLQEQLPAKYQLRPYRHPVTHQHYSQDRGAVQEPAGQKRRLSCQSKKLYIISSRTAKQLLVAIEDSTCLCYQLCGPARSCCLQLCDQDRVEVLRFCRPYRVDVCCLFCCLMVIKVFSSSNSLLGFVQQRWSLFSPSLSVHDSEGKRTMDIQGPWSAARCHSDQEFQVTSVDGQKIAIIWKRWPGFNEDYNMDHDFFGLEISASINPTDKALLLSATFLLNYMFFEMS